MAPGTEAVVVNRDGVDEVIVAGSVMLAGYDLRDGAERWRCSGLEAVSICPSPVMGDGVIYAMSYSIGEEPIPTWEKLLKPILRNANGLSLSGESPGALLVIRLSGKTFVLAFGHAWLKLQDDWLEQSFGRRVALNSIDPGKLVEVNLEQGVDRRFGAIVVGRRDIRDGRGREGARTTRQGRRKRHKSDGRHGER